MGARDDRERWTRTRAVDDGDWNVVSGVDTSGHLDDAVRTLPAQCGRGADAERRFGILAANRTITDRRNEHERAGCDFHAANFTTLSATEYSCELPPVKSYPL